MGVGFGFFLFLKKWNDIFKLRLLSVSHVCCLCTLQPTIDQTPVQILLLPWYWLTPVTSMCAVLSKTAEVEHERDLQVKFS